MRLNELLAEKDDVMAGLVFDPATGTWGPPTTPKPRLERYDIDWRKFKLTISTLGAQREGLEDFQKFDAIVLLGLFGDPKLKDIYSVNYGGEKEPPVYTQPAVFARTNDDNLKASGMERLQGIANMRSRWVGNNVANAKEFDIILNHKYVDLASGDMESHLTIVHEARHRGLHMICLIPDILNRVPADIRGESGYGTWVNANMQSYINRFHPPGKPAENIEHMLIYAVEKGNGHVHPEGIYNSVEELKQWRKWYMDIAAAAKSYVLAIPVPRGSDLEMLRKDIDDNKTPSNVSVQVKKYSDGKPTFVAVPNATQGSANTAQPGVKDSVMAIQGKLKKLGVDLGTFGPNRDGVDGTLGDKTIQAIRAYLNQKLSGQ